MPFAYFGRILFVLATFAPYALLAQGCADGTLCNPLRVDSIQELVSAILALVRIIALPIGVLFIVWGGFQLVTAGGDETKLKDGYKTILAAIIGIAIVLAAELLSNILGNTLRGLGAQV